MSEHDNNRQDTLRQELLEYYFECHPDPERIEQRLAEDAELQALFEDVKQTATLLEDAALSEAPPLQLATEPAKAKAGLRWSFRHTWYAAAAMVAIALIPAVGIYLHRAWQVHDVENSKVRLIVSAPPAIPDGSPLRFQVETYNLARKKMIAQVDWKVLDEQGETLSESTAMCDGATDITVAGQLNKPRKLIVTARVPGSGFEKTIEQSIHPTKSAPLVHVTSDKPAYRPGETVRLRVACLDRLTLRGADRVGLRCRIVDPKKAAVRTGALGIGSGVTAWTWPVPPNAAGGTYALEVRDQQDEFTLERHEFLVRNFQPPKLEKKIVLDRQTYAAGESGAADLVVSRAGGGPAAGAKVQATLVVDGDEKWKDEAVLDAEGRALFRFQVPGMVLKGAGRFVARVTDGGTVETGMEPFVIPTDKVEVALYPEGGELVAGSENRVYAQVLDAFDRPLSAEGDVVDSDGKVVTRFKTQHMGRARFTFTPIRGKSYTLKLLSPREESIAFPKVMDAGVVLRASDDFVAAGGPVELDVFTSGRGPWMASVFCRGVLVGQRAVLQRGKTKVSVPVVDEASGVLRVTVFDRRMRPVAERLIRREAKRRLTVEVTPKFERRTPGSRQQLTIKTIDETGEPVSAIVGLTVTDRAVASMLDAIRTGLHDQHQLFTDVEKPDDKVEEFLARHADHRRNIDLLLGCLGWRRYVWQGEADTEALVAAGGEWARALPVREGLSAAPLTTDTKASNEAELSVVHWSRDEAWRLLQSFAAFCLVGFGLLGLVHVLWWTARRMEWRPPVFVGGTLAGVAAALFVFVNAFSTLSADAERMDLAMSPDESMVEAETVDPGFFFDDGEGGDLRGRTEIAFRVYSAGRPTPVASLAASNQWAYVRDFDVQLSLGAKIQSNYESLLDVRTIERTVELMDALEEVQAYRNETLNGARTITTGADSFFLGPSGPASPGLVGPGTRGPGRGGAGGGRYRGPGNMIPPRPQIAVEQVFTAYEGLRMAGVELSGLPALSGKRIVQLQRQLDGQKGLLDLLNRQVPGVLPVLQPNASGTLQTVDTTSNTATIQVTRGIRQLQPGSRFTIFSVEDGYKGEATVTHVDRSQRTCTAMLSFSAGNAILIGDRASTNLGAVADADLDPLTPGKRNRLRTLLANPGLAQTIYRYTHKNGGSRQSFVETLFWQPFLVTDGSGEATVEFDVSDSITTWKVYADAHGNGRVGQGEGEFESYLPFFMQAKVPARVSEGDVLQIPVSIVAEDKSQKTAEVRFQTTGPLSLKSSAKQTVELVEGRGRAIAEVIVGLPQGPHAVGSIRVRGEVQGARDILSRRFVIRPRGFPHRTEHARKIEKVEGFTLHLPDELAKRTAEWTLRFYPSPLADMEEALQGMLREPNGCFEQVSSSNYPNVMVLGLLQASGDNVPAAAARAQRLLDKGYKKLAGYEVTGGGFDWYGKSPAHAGLTAYGLLQFTDMARVYDGVDPEMVARTRSWLLSKRDGDGGFATGGGRYRKFLGGTPATRNAYLTYALLYSGEAAAKLTAEISRIEERARVTDDAYELAVIACALHEAGSQGAVVARKRLLGMQKKDGSLLGQGSITGSRDRDLAVETTSFATLAWLASDDDTTEAAVLRAVGFLEKSRSGGGHFGGTQATVMALKALNAYLAGAARALQPGAIRVYLGEKVIAERVLTGREKRTITIDELAAHLTIGKNSVRVELTGGNSFPFSSELGFRADEPKSSGRCAVDLDTWLTKSVLREGGTTALHAIVSNATTQPVPSPMVIVGLPAGLHVEAKILDDLKRAETIAAWELTDNNEIVLYLRGLDALEKRGVVIDLVGRIPGKTKGAASRAYLYYAAGFKKWVAPLEVEVVL